MKWKRNIGISSIAAALIACGGAGGPDGVRVASLALGPTDRAGAEDAALALVGGRVLEVDRTSDDGRERFEVEVERDSGSIVEVEIGVNDGLVYEVESYTVVESDDLDPGDGLMTLQEALRLARTVVSGDLVRWELEREGPRSWDWEIELEADDGTRREVEIDARTRAIDDVSDPFGRDDDDDDDDLDDDGVSAYPDAPVDRATAEGIALELLGGRILDVDLESDDHHPYWDIEVERTSGSRVEVEIDARTGKVLEVEAYTPAETDDFDPGAGFVTLQDALAAARDEIVGALVHWEFEGDDDGGYEYDFVLRDASGALWEVEVDATSGRVDDVSAADEDDYDDDAWDDDDWDEEDDHEEDDDGEEDDEDDEDDDDDDDDEDDD